MINHSPAPAGFFIAGKSMSKKVKIVLTNSLKKNIVKESQSQRRDNMARLVDVIEAMIKEMLEENNGSATISRSDLAEKANCVPSQVTYVLSTRFSTGSGYIVESRRGGGGQITITQIKPVGTADYIRSVIQSTGDSLTQQEAKILLVNAVEAGAVKQREATSIMSAVSDRALGKVDTDIRSQVRADIFRNALAGLLI